MATAADILDVRREARLRQTEYFSQISGSRLQFIKQQPPLTVITVTKNTTSVLATPADYSFDGYRTLSLTTPAVEADVFVADVGTLITDAEVGDVIDYSKGEVYGHLQLYFSKGSVDTSTFAADLYKQLAAGYLIMKYWEGYPQGNDFWKYGRQLVDTAHARLDDIENGKFQLVTGTGARIGREVLPFQYAVIDTAPGLVPSAIYSENADVADGEEY
jgi:hypothetical protein